MSMRGMQPLRMTMLGMDMRGVHLPGMRLRLRYRCGAGALVAVLLLAALAGTGLAAHYAAQHAARQMASAFEAGRVFGAWVLAAHRASQEQDFAARLSVQRSFVLTPAELRGFGAAPPGLPERAGRDGGTPRYAAFAVGIMDDGRGQAGLPPVAMAFGVLEPARAEAAAALRSGAIAAGLAALAEAGSTDTVMAAHVPAIEGALGRSLAPDGLYVTADAGLRYADAVLYRRAQPGWPGLNRMETALDAGGNDVTGIADADGFTASISRDAEAAGSADVGGRLEAASVTAAGALTAETLAVAGTASVSGSSSAQTLAGEMLTASGTMRAGRISSTGLHGPDASIGALTVGSCGGC